MEQFSLDKWLQNKSRKVVTRDGRQVRIVWWELKCNTPIIAAIQWNQEREDAYCYDTAGRCANNVGELDLFFADEEEKLSEFKKAMIQFSHERNSLIQFEHPTEEINAHLYRYSEKLLDLARKELMSEISDFEIYDKGFKEGKKYALKDLPKWNKAHEHKEFPLHLCVMDKNMYPFLDTEVNEGDYYIELSDLKTLPKEE